MSPLPAGEGALLQARTSMTVLRVVGVLLIAGSTVALAVTGARLTAGEAVTSAILLLAWTSVARWMATRIHRQHGVLGLWSGGWLTWSHELLVAAWACWTLAQVASRWTTVALLGVGVSACALFVLGTSCHQARRLEDRLVLRLMGSETTQPVVEAVAVDARGRLSITEPRELTLGAALGDDAHGHRTVDAAWNLGLVDRPTWHAAVATRVHFAPALWAQAAARALWCPFWLLILYGVGYLEHGFYPALALAVLGGVLVVAVVLSWWRVGERPAWDEESSSMWVRDRSAEAPGHGLQVAITTIAALGCLGLVWILRMPRGGGFLPGTEWMVGAAALMERLFNRRVLLLLRRELWSTTRWSVVDAGVHHFRPMAATGRWLDASKVQATRAGDGVDVQVERDTIHGTIMGSGRQVAAFAEAVTRAREGAYR